jgi:hypothetical protein
MWSQVKAECVGNGIRWGGTPLRGEAWDAVSVPEGLSPREQITKESVKSTGNVSYPKLTFSLTSMIQDKARRTTVATLFTGVFNQASLDLFVCLFVCLGGAGD